jgi:hypothetical protein
MSGAIPPLPKYAFRAWCSVKRSTGTALPLPYYRSMLRKINQYRDSSQGPPVNESVTTLAAPDDVYGFYYASPATSALCRSNLCQQTSTNRQHVKHSSTHVRPVNSDG